MLLNSHPDIRAHDELFLGHTQTKSADAFVSAMRRSVLFRRYVSRLGSGIPFDGYVPNYLVKAFLLRLVSGRNQIAPDQVISSAGIHIFGDGDRLARCKARAVGFKLMYDQLAVVPALRKWINTAGVRVIHLVRCGALDVVLSRKVAEDRKLFHATDISAVPVIRPFDLDVSATVAAVRSIVDAQWRQHLSFSGLQHYYVCNYEELTRDVMAAGRGCAGFLACNTDVSLTPPELKKVVGQPLRDFVVNFDEVIGALRDAGLEKHPIGGNSLWSDAGS